MRCLLIIIAVAAIAAHAIADAKSIGSTSPALPDVYPSHRAAAASLADQISTALGDDPHVTSLTRIVISAAPQDLGADERRIVEDIAAKLRRTWPKTELARVTTADGTPSNGPLISIEVSQDAGVTDLQAQFSDHFCYSNSTGCVCASEAGQLEAT